MRLIVTRPEPECERTAALLRERGHEVLVMPLLQIEPIAEAELGAGPWAAVIFTSANAVRAVAAHPRFEKLAGLPAYTVGRRTQAAAAAAGFTSIVSADGDVNALVRLIASKPPVAAVVDASSGRGRAAGSSPPPTEVGSGRLRLLNSLAETRVNAGFGHSTEGSKSATADFDQGEGGVTATWPQRNLAPTQLPLLYCAGENRAGDLAGALQPHDLRVETVIVYRATLAANLPPDVRTAIASGAIDAVLHYSARTAVAFVAAATRAGIRDLSIQTRHLCLSPQVAAPLAAAGARTIEIASEANEQALLTLIGQT